MKVSISKLIYKVAMLASFITFAGTSNSYGLISRPDINWYQPPENPGFRRDLGS